MKLITKFKNNSYILKEDKESLQMLLYFKEVYKLYKCFYISKKNKKVTNAFIFQRRIRKLQMLLDFKEE